MNQFMLLGAKLGSTMPSVGLSKGSVLLVLVLVSTSWAYIFLQADTGMGDLFKTGTWSRALGFIGALAGLDTDRTPAFFTSIAWIEGWRLAYKTLAMSIIASTIAGVAVLMTFMFGARNVATGELGYGNHLVAYPCFLFTRGLFIFSRSVPELIWAFLIIFVLSPGILAGSIALAIHNYGILGKLCSEVVEDLDIRPSRALKATGAGNSKILFYSILPQVMPQFITYLLYRWEVIIRTTIIVGLAGAGGLGREFLLKFSFFHYTDITVILAWYVCLVLFVDLVSTWLRRIAR